MVSLTEAGAVEDWADGVAAIACIMIVVIGRSWLTLVGPRGQCCQILDAAALLVTFFTKAVDGQSVLLRLATPLSMGAEIEVPGGCLGCAGRRAVQSVLV